MDWDLALRRLKEGTQLAAALAAGSDDSCAWLGVYPLKLASPDTRDMLRRRGISVLPHVGPVFRVRVIEVRADLVTEDRWLCEDDLLSRVDEIVVGVDALRSMLLRLGVPSDGLEHPGEVDYPI